VTDYKADSSRTWTKFCYWIASFSVFIALFFCAERLIRTVSLSRITDKLTLTGIIFSSLTSVQVCFCNTAPRVYLGAVHKRLPQSGRRGLSSADKGVLQMRTSALFGAKNFFEIYGVSARTKVRGIEPVQTRGEGVNFCNFVRTCFIGGPLLQSVKRERSNIIWHLGRGSLLKPSECRHMRGRRFGKSSYNFYSGWNSLIHSSVCLITVMWERGWLKTSLWGRGWLKTSEYRHMREGI